MAVVLLGFVFLQVSFCTKIILKYTLTSNIHYYPLIHERSMYHIQQVFFDFNKV